LILNIFEIWSRKKCHSILIPGIECSQTFCMRQLRDGLSVRTGSLSKIFERPNAVWSNRLIWQPIQNTLMWKISVPEHDHRCGNPFLPGFTSALNLPS
jgi:hypothetical protein